tara:strand:+ start:3806 stop:4066 length:261 start_codon:yes stop_codon:yes gene_type:complete
MAPGALLMLAQPVAMAAATSTAEKSVFLINIGVHPFFVGDALGCLTALAAGARKRQRRNAGKQENRAEYRGIHAEEGREAVPAMAK